MLKKYSHSRYDNAQRHIKEAMERGERHIYMGILNFHNHKEDWMIDYEDAERLRNDGFEVETCKYDEYEISW